MQNPLADRGVRGKRVSVIARAKNGSLWDVDIVAVVELPFEIRYADNHHYIIPHIARPKPQGLAQQLWRPQTSSWSFAPLDSEDSLALETIEVLGKATAVCD